MDEVASFEDGGNLPCLLVEIKVELIEDDSEEINKELEEFAINNGFCGAFRVSTETGLNINEAMDFLLNIIIQRMETMQQKNNDDFSTEKKNFSLVTKNYKWTKKNINKNVCI